MRINITKTWWLGIVLITAASGPSSFSNTLTSIEAQQGQSLELSTKIVSSEYCVGDPELDSLRVNLRLIFANKGRGPIILYKRSSLISRIMISQNVADSAAKRFEVNSSLTQLTSGGSKCYKGSAPNNCFVVLQPNSTYEIETVTSLFVVRGDARQIAGAVKSGDHVLQVEVITWHESDKVAENLRGRWRRYGTVWYEPVTSDPMPFTVEKERKVANCT